MTASAERSKLAAVVALLLLAAAALFVVGTSIERSTVDSENHSETPAVSATATTSSESAEGSPEHQAAEQTPSPESGEAGVETGPDTAADHARESETIAGLQLESPTATAAVVAVSILLAAAVFWWSRRPVLLVVAIATVTAIALDVIELVHQIREQRTGLVFIISAILALRLATLIGTTRLWQTTEATPHPGTIA